MPATASTATIRAWAIAEGLDVAERGRLKPEILEAYQTAHARKPAKATPVARSKSTPSPSKARVAKTAPKTSAKAERPALATLLAEPEENQVPAIPDPEIVKLREAVEALTVRVSKLEAASTLPAGRRKFGRRT